jgi:hypothetical protein
MGFMSFYFLVIIIYQRFVRIDKDVSPAINCIQYLVPIVVIAAEETVR